MRKRQIKKNFKKGWFTMYPDYSKKAFTIAVMNALAPFEELRRFDKATRKAQLDAERLNQAFHFFVEIASADFNPNS